MSKATEEAGKKSPLTTGFNAVSARDPKTETYNSALSWYLGAVKQGRSVAQNTVVDLHDFGRY
jgi:hypothetical protein